MKVLDNRGRWIKMKRKAQSILEYTIILAVIIGALVVAGTKMKSAVTKGMDDATDAMDASTSKFSSSFSK